MSSTFAGPLRSTHGVVPAHNQRVEALARRIALHIESLAPNGRARCLDIGCGDMTLAEAVHARAGRTQWHCIDVHRPPGTGNDPRWNKYRTFDGHTIPHADNEFDVALICDVLHHTPENAARLLAEASRVARRVLVKDHFESGWCSRTLLRLTDVVDNWALGFHVPHRYFTREAFARLVGEQRLAIAALDCGLELYGHLPVVRNMLQPKWQFIAVLYRA